MDCFGSGLMKDIPLNVGEWKFGCESCFLIWCIEVRLSVAIWG